MKIGAQLYTLHDQTKTLEAFDTVLAKIADIGFKYVQVSGTCAFEPDWLASTLKKYGLSCVLTHTAPADILENPLQVVQNHNTFDCKYIGIGGMPHLWEYKGYTNEQVVNEFIEKYTPAFEAFLAQGKYFMYHNHHFEFAKMPSGRTMLEELVYKIPAEHMGFTLDTYWVQFGGFDPAKIIRSLKGRVPCVHFKDYEVLRCPNEETNVRYAPVGSGNLDWDGIISACKEAGTEFALIEQDNCFGADPFACLKQSFEFLKVKGLEVE